MKKAWITRENKVRPPGRKKGILLPSDIHHKKEKKHFSGGHRGKRRGVGKQRSQVINQGLRGGGGKEKVRSPPQKPIVDRQSISEDQKKERVDIVHGGDPNRL